MKTNPNIPNELYYLDEGFSVRSLRKYQLKEILDRHNIPYLHSITRNDLINLFKKHIEPKRDDILAAYKKREQQRVEPSTPELVREQRTVKVGTEPRQLKKVDKDGFAIPAKPRRVRFNPEDSFDDSEVEQSTKKPLKRPLSSPSSSSVIKAQTTVKKSIKHFNPEDSFASDSGEEEEQVNSPNKPPQEITIHKSKKEEESDESDPDYDADADITDEEEEEEEEELGDVEQEELVMLYKDQSVPAERLASSAYPIKTRAQRLMEAKQRYTIWKNRLRRIGYLFCFVYMLVALLALGVTTYARQKNGYCSNQPLLGHNHVSFLVSLLPSPCIPCPDHGLCVDGELECEPLYEQKRPFYNPNGLLPIADDCIHNSVLGRYVAQVEKKMKRQLAVRQGEITCAHLLAHADTTPVPMARVLVKDILTDIKASVEPYLPADKMEEIMVIALSAVLEDPHIHYWEIDDKKYLGTDLVEYSTLCQIKQLYRRIPFKIKMYMIVAISILSAIYGASRDYRRNRLYQEKINQLVKSTLDQLKDQHEKYTQDPTAYPSPTLPVSQLRLAVVDVNNKKTMEDWHRVVEKIESNPHVRKSFKEVRGDPVEHWELIV